jgi:hypothetical protein
MPWLRTLLDGGDDAFEGARSRAQGGSAQSDTGTMRRSLLGDRGTSPRRSLGQENPRRPPSDDVSHQSVVGTVVAHALWHRSVVARAFGTFRRDGSVATRIRGYMMDLADLAREGEASFGAEID